METFAHLDRLLRDFRWSLLQVELLETLALGSLLAVIVAGAGVGLCAGFPDADAARVVVVVLGGAVVLGSLGQAALQAFRLFRDPVGVVARLRVAYPEVGPGLETVIRLRPALERPEGPPFSAALLVAEAARAVARLERLPPRPPADLARTRRVIVATSVVVAVLIAVTAARPGDVARGVRRLTGIEGRVIPSWMALPEEDADLLVYDVKTFWLIAHPDGSSTRVAAGEAADIVAPAGVGVEVTGHLTRPARRGSVVVIAGGERSEVPLTITSEERFSFVLPEVRDGTWLVHVLTTAGTRVREKTGRRIVTIRVEPPAVVVDPQGSIPVKADGTATISYSTDSRVGVAQVEAVVRFPFAPARPPVRVSLKTPAPGEHRVGGDFSFAWPGDPTEFAGRADLEIEALDWLSRGALDAGRSARVRFVLDTGLTRRLAEIEAADDLVGEMARTLGDVGAGATADPRSPTAEGESGGARSGDRPAGSRPAWPTRSRGQAPAEVEAGIEWADVLDRARRALAGVSAGPDPRAPSAEDVRVLESAILDLQSAVRREWASFRSLRLADLDREAARWRAVPARPDPRWVQGLRESLSRARQTLAVLYGIEQRDLQRGDPASTGRVTSYRRAEACTKARDAVAAALDLLSSDADRSRWADGATRSRLAEALGRCLDAVEKVEHVYRASLSRVERVAFGEIVVSPEVALAVKDVIEAQREVHDRTAQTAFEWKNRADLAASGPAPDRRDLQQRVGEARRRLERVPLERLDPREAAEVARAREDLAAIADLIDAPDFASALEQARNLTERMARMASEMGDQADWLAEERPEGAAVLARTARNLGLAARSLREATRSLAAWKARAEAPPTPAMRAGVTEILDGQNRVISALDKAVEPLGPGAGAWAVELVGMAGSARRNMSEAAARLAEARPSAAEVHQRQAVQDLLRLKRALDRGPFETLRRQAKAGEDERISLPVPEPRPPADELRDEIRRHQDEPPAPGTEDLVRAYYESLMK